MLITAEYLQMVKILKATNYPTLIFLTLLTEFVKNSTLLQARGPLMDQE